MSNVILTIINIAVLIAFTVYLLRRWCSSFLLPLLGVGLLIITLAGKFSLNSDALSDSGHADIEIAQVLGITSGTGEALLFAAFFSFALILLNIIPCYPLDGGQIIGVALGRLNERTQKVFQKAGPWLLIIFFLLAIF